MDPNDVPDDFPQPTLPAVVPTQPKAGFAVSWNVYLRGLTPEDRYERWLMCEGMAEQWVSVARDDIANYPNQSPDETLERVHLSVAREELLSPAELQWLLQRMKVLLQW